MVGAHNRVHAGCAGEGRAVSFCATVEHGGTYCCRDESTLRIAGEGAVRGLDGVLACQRTRTGSAVAPHGTAGESRYAAKCRLRSDLEAIRTVGRARQTMGKHRGICVEVHVHASQCIAMRRDAAHLDA